MKGAEIKELLRRKEIVEWQISIARERRIIDLREAELKEINNQLKKHTE